MWRIAKSASRGGRRVLPAGRIGPLRRQVASSTPAAATAVATEKRSLPADGLKLQDFVAGATESSVDVEAGESEMVMDGTSAQDTAASLFGRTPTFFIETYGCQMNVSDSEVVRAVMLREGYQQADSVEEADVILTNTCAIRDNAEQRVKGRLGYFKHLKQNRKAGDRPVVGVLGCMAERLKQSLLEGPLKVDIVVGPDAYRDLPNLVRLCKGEGERGVNVQLSQDETYADITPVRDSATGAQSFLTIMRGCNNMCAFCIVPFTRGRERSRPVESIVDEARRLRDSGSHEIVLLGQNVNSYHDRTGASDESQWALSSYETASGFGNTFKLRDGAGVRFTELLHRVSEAVPETRVRFTSPHPKDYPLALLQLMAERDNICNQVHMPAQSGNTRMLEVMRRHYSREAYIELVERIRTEIPGVAISTDMISGFCSETEEEHEDTVSLMNIVKYEQAFTFAYSMRDKTRAHRRMTDDVPEDVKLRRLQEVIAAFEAGSLERNAADIGTRHAVLVEGRSRKYDQGRRTLTGRTDSNKRVVLVDAPVSTSYSDVLADLGAVALPSQSAWHDHLPTEVRSSVEEALLASAGGLVPSRMPVGGAGLPGPEGRLPGQWWGDASELAPLSQLLDDEGLMRAGAAVQEATQRLERARGGAGAQVQLEAGDIAAVEVIGFRGRSIVAVPLARTTDAEFHKAHRKALASARG